MRRMREAEKGASYHAKEWRVEVSVAGCARLDCEKKALLGRSGVAVKRRERGKVG